MGLISRLVRDSTVLTWRPIAKNGFALPAAHPVMRPSVVNLTSGETADFEFASEQQGEIVLEFAAPPQHVQGRTTWDANSATRLRAVDQNRDPELGDR